MENKKGFTLAEVLITLGIIGVVAAMTMPTLTAKYQKHITVNKLKQTYSILYQAIKLSEIDNGDITEWNYEDINTKEDHVAWINKYISPYLKHTSVEGVSMPDGYDRADIKLVNGVTVRIWCSPYMNGKNIHLFVFFGEPVTYVTNGKNQFTFLMNPSSNRLLYTQNKKIIPYDEVTSSYPEGTELREMFINDPIYGCKQGANQMLCAALIMVDNWQIKDDYPW